MANEAAILAAITDSKTQACKSYAQTTKKYNIERTTLSRRFKGQTAPNSAARIEAQGLLDATLKKALVERINKLSLRGIPPTPKTVENLIQELTQQSKRVADNNQRFEHYFKLVKSKMSIIANILRLISAA